MRYMHVQGIQGNVYKASVQKWTRLLLINNSADRQLMENY